MPELPEVETTRRGLDPWVQGARIREIRVHNAALRWPVELPDDLAGREINALRRRAKYLLFDVATGHVIVHLGMSGSLRVVEPGAALRPHDHVEFDLGERVLRLHDPRRFGCVLYQPGAPEAHPLLAHLGPEPLGNEFSGDHLFRQSRKRRVAVKNLIMDGRVVVGVGNIYAAEALFMAGIRPSVAAGRVSRSGYDALADAIRRVLGDAIRQGGTTLRDFVGSDGNPGYFRQRLYVYGRAGAPCRICGQPLRGKRLGQRSTVFCSQCQRRSGFQSPLS